MARPYAAAALPVAHLVLRVLIVLNWLFGIGLVVMLTMMFVYETWTLKALGVAASAIPDMAFGMRTIPVLGLVAIPLNDLILRRMRAIVETVRASDPFVAANADRLQAIAWALLALQLISIVIAAVADGISTPAHPLHLDAGFSITGWLAVLLTFVLARVFAEGARMRADLEGTV